MKISAIQAIAILLPCIALQVAALKLGFVGLGAMGKHMAGHLQKSAFCNTANPLQVWNRGAGVAEVHAQCYGSQSVSLEALSLCDVIFLSLPNTAVVVEVLGALMSLNLRPGSLIVDTTSGEPAATAVISADLRKIGVRFVDCPVSGGPAGAEAGSLTTMLGGDKTTVESEVMPLVLGSFSKKAVLCGPVGCGMAVKAVNNALNTAHLLIGAEGLLALKGYGVEPNVALDVINSSSGRSLATQERLPQEVLSGEFNYGFKLSLMAKDCRIAEGVVREHFREASLLPAVAALTNEAERLGYTDYTEVVRVLESRAGRDLRCPTTPTSTIPTIPITPTTPTPTTPTPAAPTAAPALAGPAV